MGPGTLPYLKRYGEISPKDPLVTILRDQRSVRASPLRVEKWLTRVCLIGLL